MPVTRRRFWLTAALVAVPMVFVAPSASAKLAIVTSVELRARDADIVITGKVMAVRELKTSPKEGSKAYREVVIATDLALKGNRQKVYRFVDLKRRHHAPKDGAEVLAFLDLGSRHKDVPPSLSRGYVGARMFSMDGPVITLSGLIRRGLPSRSFTMLHDKAAVVRAIRAGLATTAFVAGEARFDAPSKSAVFKAYYAGSAVHVSVPLDAATETLALRRMTDKAWHRQEEGLKAIVHFPKATNRAKVEALRDASRHPRVKKAAEDVLKRWKAKGGKKR